MIFYFLFFLIIFPIVYGENAFNGVNETFVETKFGKLKGFQLELDNEKKVNIFLGVPFAKPPISKLRFEVFVKNI